MDRVTSDIVEIKIDIGDLRNKFNGIRNNELKHFKSGKSYWIKLMGAGTLGAIVLKFVESLPALLSALRAFF